MTTAAEIATQLRAAGCVFAEDEARLLVAASGSSDDLAALVQRRIGGTPLEHLLGWAEFAGLRIEVTAGVFVPRRRTQLLARQAARLAVPGTVVVELCCGAGAVATAVAVAVPGVEVHATDLDPAAVRCARRNVPGFVYEGDLYDALPTVLRSRVDVLVANAPYVPTNAVATMPPEARLHEPLLALDGGSDGLDVLRRIIAAAPEWVRPGGHLLVESSRNQAGDLADAMERSGFAASVIRDGLLDATAVLGLGSGLQRTGQTT